MKIRLSILLLAATLAVLRAGDPNTPPPTPEGIIMLRAVAGYPAADTWFVSIQWVDKDSGYVTDKAGNKLPFLNAAIGRIIYFDKIYYEEIDHNQYWIDWRAGLQSHEVVMPPISPDGLRPEDAKRLTEEQATLQDAIQRYPDVSNVVQPLIDTLKDEVTKLGSGLVPQNGAWVAAKDAPPPEEVPVVGDSDAPVNFTTKDGKRFQNAKITVTDTGLSVLTADGGSSVSFDRLPDDLSPFPRAAQKKIADWRARNPDAATAATASSSGWWAWITATWQFVAGEVESLFAPSKPLSGPGGSS